VHMSTDRPIWPQGVARPAGEPPPANLDWDLWLGPAPQRPFSPYYHPFNWRGWYDFGTGALGDMALHSWHFFWDALKLTYPARISATVALATEAERSVDPGRGVRLRTKKVRPPETFPHAEIVTFEFPERNGLPPLRLLWYDGGLLPPRPEGLAVNEAAPTNYYVGEKGVLIPVRRRRPAPAQAEGGPGGAAPRMVDVTEFLVLANGKPKPFTPPRKTIPRSVGHYQEWIAAAKGGKPAACNFEYGRLFAETALLGVVAVRTGKDLEYDPQNVRFTNDAAANEHLNPPYRAGWSL